MRILRVLALALYVASSRPRDREGRESVQELQAGVSARDSRWALHRRDLVVALFVAALTVGATKYLDDRRATREAKQAERLGWRATFAGSDAFQDSDLGEVDLSSFSLSRKDLSRVSFRDAKLDQAVIRGSGLMQADMTRASLSRAFITATTLKDADVTAASFRSVRFEEADLSGVDFRQAQSTAGADFTAVCYDADTRWTAEAPPLDWRSCWEGYDDEAGVEARSGPGSETTCTPEEVTTTDMIYLRSITYPGDESVCAYLNYLEAKTIRADRDSALSTGAFGCDQFEQVDAEVLVRVLNPVDDSVDVDTGRTTLFAAGKFLCPDLDEAITEVLQRMGP